MKIRKIDSLWTESILVSPAVERLAGNLLFHNLDLTKSQAGLPDDLF
jgi:hypothetical protein